MLYSADYKNLAKQRLGNEWGRGKWATFAFSTFIYLLILTVFNGIDFYSGMFSALVFYTDAGYLISSGLSSIFSLVITGAFSYAFSAISLKVVRGVDITEGDIWCGFKKFYKTFLLNILNSIYIFLFTLLFIVPGIIKAISYSMSYYLLADDDKLTANEARLRSVELMKGHKLDFFCLCVSFVGWFLLGVITCGIVLIWVIPYYKSSVAVFYQDIIGEIKTEKPHLEDKFNSGEEKQDNDL